MRLKDKQTGEVGDYAIVNRVGKHCVGVAKDGDIDNPIFFDSIAELNERFEDAPEEKKYGGRVPKICEKYFFLDSEGDIGSDEWGSCSIDKARFDVGNAFWTEEETERELARRKAYTILKEDTEGFKPPKNPDEVEEIRNLRVVYYEVGYDQCLAKLEINSRICGLYNRGLYFATEEDARASIEAHEKEWKTWLGVEE